MRKIALAALFTCIYLQGSGQVASYTEANTVGTYTALVGGTALTPPNATMSGAGWFEQTYNVTLPFVYFFNGIGYSSVFINSNGYVTFGNAEFGNNPRPNLVNNGVNGAIMAMACATTYGYMGGAGTVLLGSLVDQSNANPIMYGTIGTAPNRIFVAQWTNAVRSVTYYGSNGTGIESVTFQIRLLEGSNVAEIVFNTSTTPYSPPYNPMVGLSGATTADYSIMNGNWATATPITSGAASILFNSGNPAPAGQTYDFTPSAGQMPTACSGTPPAATALATTGITTGGGGSLGLSLSNLPLKTGLTYQWQVSPTGLAKSWANITGATTPSYTYSPSAAGYYQCLVACGGGASVASSSVVVGYESSYPALPSYTYNSDAGYPSDNIGLFTIAGGACGSTLNDIENSVSNYNYQVFNGTSGTQYSYVSYTANATHIKLQGSTTINPTFTATINNVGGNVGIAGVWIDLNDNGSFADAGEYVGSVAGLNGTATNFTLTLPVNNFGVHRMRVRTAWSGFYNIATIAPTGPLNYFGQANDYMVEVIPPTPTATNNSPVCVTGTLGLTSPALTGATYTWTGPLAYYSTTTSTTQSYTVPSIGAAGVYTVVTTVDGSNACVPSAITTVTVNPQPSLTTVTNSGPICSGNTLTLTSTGPSNVLGYSWSGPVAVTSSTTPIATVPAAPASASGTYSVAVNNGAGSGCTVTYTTTATVNASPDVTTFSVPSATSPCKGFGSIVSVNSTSLTAGTYTVTYSLTGANVTAGATSTMVIAGSAGTFTTAALAGVGSTTVTVTAVQNAAGCPTNVITGNFASFSVNPLPAAITGTNFVCPGQTTALSDGSAGGAWTSSNTTLATVSGTTGVVSGVAAGTPTVTYTLPTGCLITTTVTVYSLPAAITGTNVVCQGSTTQLTDATATGAWTSSSTTNATVNFTGLVTGVSASNPNITYTIPSTTCFVTYPVTVNPLPAAITGNMNVCTGGTTALSDATPLGTWSSSNTSSATVSGTGLVSGVSPGFPNIIYTLPTGCNVFATIFVNQTPGAITGVQKVCQGSVTTLSDATPFGNWSSGNTSIATVDNAGNVTGGVSPGVANISYTGAGGCYATTTVTVQTTPAAITGNTGVCTGSTTALSDATLSGVWTSSNTAFATVSPTGLVSGISAGMLTVSYSLATGCFNTTPVTVNDVPLPVTGTANVCIGSITVLSDASGSGTWTSSNTTKATVDNFGNVTGVATGNPTITFALGTGCISTYPVTVNPNPVAITGTMNVCPGLTTALNDGTALGTWSVDNTSLATVSGTGVVSGVSAGTPHVTYTLPTGCIAATPVTVNPLPSPIGGTMTVCAGLTTALNDPTIPGVWSSSNTAFATVDASGLVTGVLPSVPRITYTLTTGCYITTAVVVNTNPGPISGTKNVCAGSTVTLLDGGGGTWTSGNTSLATVDNFGNLTGVSPGNPNITYTFTSTGCITSTQVTVNALPGGITGTASACIGSSSSLAGSGGGTWSSSNTSMAIVDGTGLVTAKSVGTPNITYTIGTGCYATIPFAVNSLPASISGTTNVCVGATTGLSDLSGAGTWTSSSTAASVDAFGNVTGLSAGVSNIIFTLPTGCVTSTPVNVKALPGIITGITNVCVGATTTLADGGSGVWSSSNTSATVSSTGVVTGVSAGTPNITFQLSTGCFMTTMLAVNPLPLAITTATTFSACPAATTALSDASGSGNWTSSNTTLATVDASGLVTAVAAGTPNIVYTLGTGCKTMQAFVVNPLPDAGIVMGSSIVCVGASTTLTDAISGGIWSSSNPSATIGSTGVVSGVTTGTTTIMYSVTNICSTATTTVVVNVDSLANAGAITGLSTVCQGASITLSDAVAGGGWHRSNTKAFVSTGGVVAGLSAGVDTIIYTIVNVCGASSVSASVTVVTSTPFAGGLTGAAQVCVGSKITLADTITGGAWSSNNANATVAGGVVTGAIGDTSADPFAVPNTSTIIYTISNGCGSSTASKVVTIIPLPTLYNVLGGGSYCPGGNGVYVYLSGSATDDKVYYKLYKDTTYVTDMPGLGTSFNFGLQTAPGIYTIVGTDGNGCTRKMNGSATIALLPSSVCNVEVKPVVNVAELGVMPNPNKGTFTVKGSLGTLTDEEVSLEITNMLGQVIYKNKVVAQGGMLNEQVQLGRNMASGMYLLNVRSAVANNVFHIVIEQ